ncbi:MAG TPA: hypothetical protein VF458_02045 [Ktedonobacteraceae bacterium]
MRLIDPIFAKAVLFLILSAFDVFFLLTGYGLLRALRVSVNWVTWLIGGFLITLSLAACLAVLQPGLFPSRFRIIGNPIGAIAFFIAVYAASQWITRQWFLRVKQSASQWLKQFSKNILIFLRKHHVFFGWIVAAGSLAHMVFFMPVLTRISLYEEITGFIALGTLALMALLGAWLWIMSLCKQRMPRIVHTIHALLTIVFFIALLLHI